DAAVGRPADQDQQGEGDRHADLEGDGLAQAEHADEFSLDDGIAHRVPPATASREACSTEVWGAAGGSWPCGSLRVTVRKASSRSLCSSRNWTAGIPPETMAASRPLSSSSDRPVRKRTTASARETVSSSESRKLSRSSSA